MTILDYLGIEKEKPSREKELLDAITYGVFAPIIVDPRWPEVNQDLILKAKGIRMLEAPKCIEEEMATEFDALIYLHTASMCVPFNETWFRIYCYLFQKYFPKHAEKLNISVKELNSYEKYELERLRKWIFQKQIKAIKKR